MDCLSGFDEPTQTDIDFVPASDWSERVNAAVEIDPEETRTIELEKKEQTEEERRQNEHKKQQKPSKD